MVVIWWISKLRIFSLSNLMNSAINIFLRILWEKSLIYGKIHHLNLTRKSLTEIYWGGGSLEVSNVRRKK